MVGLPAHGPAIATEPNPASPPSSVSAYVVVHPGRRWMESCTIWQSISRRCWSRMARTVAEAVGVAAARMVPPPSDVAALHLLHQVIASTDREGHDRQRRVLAAAGDERRRIHHVQV